MCSTAAAAAAAAAAVVHGIDPEIRRPVSEESTIDKSSTGTLLETRHYPVRKQIYSSIIPVRTAYKQLDKAALERIYLQKVRFQIQPWDQVILYWYRGGGVDVVRQRGVIHTHNERRI